MHARDPSKKPVPGTVLSTLVLVWGGGGGGTGESRSDRGEVSVPERAWGRGEGCGKERERKRSEAWPHSGEKMGPGVAFMWGSVGRRGLAGKAPGLPSLGAWEGRGSGPQDRRWEGGGGWGGRAGERRGGRLSAEGCAGGSSRASGRFPDALLAPRGCVLSPPPTGAAELCSPARAPPSRLAWPPRDQDPGKEPRAGEREGGCASGAAQGVGAVTCCLCVKACVSMSDFRRLTRGGSWGAWGPSRGRRPGEPALNLPATLPAQSQSAEQRRRL